MGIIPNEPYFDDSELTDPTEIAIAGRMRHRLDSPVCIGGNMVYFQTAEPPKRPTPRPPSDYVSVPLKERRKELKRKQHGRRRQYPT